MASKYDMIRDAATESCKGCEELKGRVSELQSQVRLLTAEKNALQGRVTSLTTTPGLRIVDLSKPFYRQAFSLNAECPLCRSSLYVPTENEGHVRRRSAKDEQACSGKRWWRLWRSNCIETAHIHRHCGWCNAQWVEYP